MVTGPPKFRKKRCHFSIGRMSKSQHKKGMWDGRYCCGYLCEISSSTLGWMCFLSTLSSTPPDLKKKKKACVPPSLDCELRQGRDCDLLTFASSVAQCLAQSTRIYWIEPNRKEESEGLLGPLSCWLLVAWGKFDQGNKRNVREKYLNTFLGPQAIPCDCVMYDKGVFASLCFSHCI